MKPSNVYRFFKIRDSEITMITTEYKKRMARYIAASDKLKKKYGIVRYALYEHTERKEKLNRRGIVERTSEDYMDLFAILRKAEEHPGFTDIKVRIDIPKEYLASIKASYDLCKLDLRTKAGKITLQEFLDVEKLRTIDHDLGDYIAGYFGLLHNDVEYREPLNREPGMGIVMRYDTFAQRVKGLEGEDDVWIFAVPVWNMADSDDPNSLESGLHEDYEADLPVVEIQAAEFLKYRANTPPNLA